MEESKEFPACFHRVTIKGMYVRDGKILMVREAHSMSGLWELPGGGLDFGEHIRLGFEREVEEEMGLKVSKMSSQPLYVWTHRYDKKRKLEWYYSLVLAYRMELASLDFTPTDECAEIKFFSKEELAANDMVSGQMRELTRIFDPNDFVADF
jgi:8-oxo-dGTP diphosphatase